MRVRACVRVRASWGSFEYRLQLLHAGTFFYHSHIPLQYGDGLLGSLIVDPAEAVDPVRAMYTYDEERLVFLNEWFHADAAVLAATALAVPADVWRLNSPRSVLINGRGRCDCADAVPANHCNANAPLEVLSVTPGYRYRLRIIAAGTRVALSFHIEGHTLTVVQAQGEPVEPIEVEQLELAIGDRYDVLLDADRPPGNYWLASQIIGCTNCMPNSTINDTPSFGMRGLAVLHYDTAPPLGTANATLSSAPYEPTRAYQPVSFASPGTLEFNDARLVLAQPLSPPPPTMTWHLNATKIAPEVLWRINGYQYHHPQVPVLLDVMRGRSFPVESLVWTVPFGAVLDIVFYSFNNMDHPIHMHGYKFFFLGWGQGVPTDDALANLNTRNPMLLDTAHCPGRGWIAFRLVANRPGPWMLHCVRQGVSRYNLWLQLYD